MLRHTLSVLTLLTVVSASAPALAGTPLQDWAAKFGRCSATLDAADVVLETMPEGVKARPSLATAKEGLIVAESASRQIWAKLIEAGHESFGREQAVLLGRWDLDYRQAYAETARAAIRRAQTSGWSTEVISYEFTPCLAFAQEVEDLVKRLRGTASRGK